MPFTWRGSLDISMTRGLSGGHFEDSGLTEDGHFLDVEKHRHEVDLDLVRVGLSLSNTLSDVWDIGVMMPYFIKSQNASVSFSEGTSDLDQDAAIRGGQIHHRTETYEGFGDAELMAGFKLYEILGEKSILRLGFGFTVPTGDTEEDPWLLGDLGSRHIHIQFGNGTFDPLLNFYLSKPITEKLAWSIYGRGRMPFYRNDKGYRGPLEFTLSPRLTWLINSDFSLSGGISVQYFDYANWETSGRDPNSGLFSATGSLGIGYDVTDDITLSIGAVVPFYEKQFGSGDELELAPSFSFSLGYTF